MDTETTDKKTSLSDLYKFDATTGTIDPADYADVEYQVKSDVCSALEIGEVDKVEMSTPMGRFIEWLSIFFTDVLGLNVQNANQLLISAAAGQQLDAIAQWFQLERKAGTYSSVDVTCVGSAGTVIPQGSTVRNENGDFFESLEEAVLDENGKATVRFEAVSEGAIGVSQGTVNSIGTPIAGWEYCINDEKGILGSLIETDESLRARIMNARAVAPGFLEAIKNAIDAVIGSGNAMVLENNTSAHLEVHGVDMEPHSILACVSGLPQPTGDYVDNPTVKAVAKAIFDNKPCGTGYTTAVGNGILGNNIINNHLYEVPVTDAFGNNYNVYFCSPIEQEVNFFLTVQNRNYTGANMLKDVEDAVKEWIAETNFKCGEDIFSSEVIKEVESRVSGVVVVVCTLSKAGQDKSTSYVQIDAIHYATLGTVQVLKYTS